MEKPVEEKKEISGSGHKFGWDTAQWIEFVSEAKYKSIEEARAIYKEFLAVFPTAYKYWKIFIEQEIDAKNYEEVDILFKECLLKVPHVSLWQCYLNYCRITTKNRENGTKILEQSYEYAIENIKYDVNATPIWIDYFQFLQEAPPSSGFEGQNARATKVRETFDKAVEIPLANSSEIWDRYMAWLDTLNKSYKTKVSEKRYPKQLQCRVIYRERKTLDDNLPTIRIAVPPGEGNQDVERSAVKFWKKIIRFEKRNPQRVSALQLREQVVYTYKQCLLTLLHYPEIWYDYAKYYADEGLPEEALNVYKKAVSYLPGSVLLHLSYADFLEQLNRPKDAEQVYQKLLQVKNETLVWIQYMFFEQRVFGVKKARKTFLQAHKQPTCTYHIYVASAMMEFYQNKDAELARKIFDRAFQQKFGKETEFIVHYLKFLWNMNEAQNTRVMFERVLSTIPVDKSKVIWNLYLEFEYECGDAKTVSQLERRKAEQFPDEDPNGILALVNRHRYQDLWPCNLATLDSFEVDEKDKESEENQAKIQEELATKYPRPDFSNMVQYREPMSVLTPIMLGPSIPQPTGEVTIEMNEADDSYSNLPDPLVDFLARLPPSDSHNGPLPDIDKILQYVREANLPPLQDSSVALGKRKGMQDKDNSDKPPSKKHKGQTQDAWRKRHAKRNR